MKSLKQFQEASSKIDSTAYYAVYRDGNDGPLKVAGPYTTESVAFDYHWDGIVEVLTGAELVKSKYKSIRVQKEEVEIEEATFKSGDTVKVPHKGKLVKGKIVRFDGGGTSKAQQHGGGYIVDVGEPASILVPAHKVQIAEAVPGKPMTMAQQHTELLSGPINAATGMRDTGGTIKHYRAWIAQVVKDWDSGEMELSRMESVISDLQGLAGNDPAFRKAMKAHERILRMGKGSGYVVSMPRITFNQIAACLKAANEYLKSAKDITRYTP